MGRVWTKLQDEEPIACSLGPQGFCVCLAALPIGCYQPIFGMACMGVLSNILRSKVITKYNVEEEDVCCCSTPFNQCFNDLNFCFHYPCSLFQMDMAMERWQQEKRLSPTLAIPVV